jgi:anti-anti-sigma regulatory factor
MLRTRRTGNGQVLFTLSGRIESTEDIKQLQELLAAERSGQKLILDLRDVTLVSQDAVKFLCRCEADGIKLENCPLHVRRWIDQVNDRGVRRKEL